MLPSVIGGPDGVFGLVAIYSALSTEMIFSIEYVCPTLWKVPITRHLSPTEQGFRSIAQRHRRAGFVALLHHSMIRVAVGRLGNDVTRRASASWC